MEAVARQFATDEHVLVIRNGYFSYRWTEIFEFGGIPHSHTVLKARPNSESSPAHQQYTPPSIEKVLAAIDRERPKVLFAPHVETSTGIMLPDEYIQQMAQAMHGVGGMVVLDCIASGSIWIDMVALGVDVLISAPQKSWTAPPCAALVLMNSKAHSEMLKKEETSFAMSLKRWSAVMEAYKQGTWAYHTTPPTDALRDLQEVSVEMLNIGLDKLKNYQFDLGIEARGLLDSKGLTSVAAPGFQAPSVLVYYSPSDTIENPLMVRLFHQQGLQIAMGVPWMLDEPVGLKSFRIGLFGLDKLENIPRTIGMLKVAVDHVLSETASV